MKIAICDDEASCRAQAMAAAEQYVEKNKDKNISFTPFSHPEDLLEAAEKCGGYDIYVLDIVMPGMNGIALGLKLREAGYDGKIIYLTSSEEYSLDAFRVKAFDYILKPITDESFSRAIDEAAAQIAEKKDKYVLVKSKERSVKLTCESIMYAALNRRSISYYLVGGRVVESVSLRGTFSDAMAELLADRRFCLCSVGMVVNLDHITEIENEAVVFGNTYRPFLGEKYCRKLRNVWSNYLFDGEG